MKHFLRKSLFILYPLVVYLVLIFTVPKLVKTQMAIPAEFIQKLNESNLLVCGDSRANRQIDPAILHKNTNLQVLNFSNDAWDLYAVSKALKAVDCQNKIILISVSAYQINDGALDDGYLGLDCYSDLTFAEQFQLYKFRWFNWILIQDRLFKRTLFENNFVSTFGNYSRTLNKEYLPQVCKKFSANLKIAFNHPWYENHQNKGIKAELLSKGLANLASLKNCKIMVFNGPISKDFEALSTHFHIAETEHEMDAFLADACKKVGVSYVSYFDDESMKNNLYYNDIQHLCGTGAEIFTQKISQRLKEENLLPVSN